MGLLRPFLDPLAYMFYHLHAMDSLDLPLVGHLLTSWWPAYILIWFYLYIYFSWAAQNFKSIEMYNLD